MTEPVVTRAHRLAALHALYGITESEVSVSKNRALQWLDNPEDESGLWDETAPRVALALATVEHNARQGAEPKWALASAELPDSDVRVLVRGTDGDIVSAELEFTDDSEGHGKPYWVSEGSDLVFRDYPHWMPRPEDPPPVGPNNG